MIAKSSRSLPGQFEKLSPAQIRNNGISSNETESRHLNLKKRLSVNKSAVVGNVNVYDGHGMDPQCSHECRRNIGAGRTELDKKANSSKPTESSSLNVSDVTAGFASFNQDDSVASTTASSCASSKSNTSATQAPQNISLSKQTPSVIKHSSPQYRNTVAASTENEVISSSSIQKMIRRKKSSPNHRNHEKNLRLPSIMRSPRYSKCKPEDLASSFQELGLTGRVVDERLTKSMTDLEAGWGDSVDFNSVHFRKNVEVYLYKS